MITPQDITENNPTVAYATGYQAGLLEINGIRKDGVFGLIQGTKFEQDEPDKGTVKFSILVPQDISEADKGRLRNYLIAECAQRGIDGKAGEWESYSLDETANGEQSPKVTGSILTIAGIPSTQAEQVGQLDGEISQGRLAETTILQGQAASSKSNGWNWLTPVVVGLGLSGIATAVTLMPLHPATQRKERPWDEPYKKIWQQKDYTILAKGDFGQVIDVQENTRSLDATDLDGKRNIVWITNAIPTELTITPPPDTAGKDATQITTLAIEASALQGLELRFNQEFSDTRMHNVNGASNATTTVIDVGVQNSIGSVGRLILPGQGDHAPGQNNLEQPGIFQIVVTNGGVPVGEPVLFRNTSSPAETQAGLAQVNALAHSVSSSALKPIEGEATKVLGAKYLGLRFGMLTGADVQYSSGPGGL